jgi:transcriptional regulator with XRE-family HTH domain
VLTGNRNGDQLIRDQFAKRLYHAIVNKAWTQSELARRSGLTRNAVSTYVTARALPTPANLDALAKALGVAADELLPPVRDALAPATATIETCSFREVEGGQARLQVNKIVPMDTALEVIRLVNSDKAKSAN